MRDWVNTANQLLLEMEEQKFPESVADTVTGAIQFNPDKAEEIAAKVRSCKTPREAVKAVQMYL